MIYYNYYYYVIFIYFIYFFRILNSVSKLIPEEKSELYFKTYNFVKNKFYTTKSLVPENLSEWCLENY